ncbi:ABC transporter permease [Actinophytocola xinjiangensis]|uniref:ABC transporter permease n=1 Tax=Actinophytocola xinjiangensis TaxID=485602 RepID=A0A7Z1AYY4_9PSEU|nr:ABC transporter permease [Actinophytocola xinjiangensis]OLF12324.1 ABC transporter permease [Actinophytocola xinjiangensis]
MGFGDYLARRWEDIVLLGIGHLQVVLIAVGIAAVIAIVLGSLVAGHPAASRPVLAITGTMLTIPSFALFGLLIPLFGLGVTPSVVALVLYAIFPIVRNTVTGLEAVPPEVLDAARGMGLGSVRRLVVVRLPLAWPVILTGIRLATLMNVGIAAIAAAVNGPGLGKLIFDGLARIGGANALNDTLAGVLGVAVLALVLDLLFLGLVRMTTSRGLR